MDSPQPDASWDTSKAVEHGEAICTVIDDVMPCTLVNVSSPVASTTPTENILDSNGALVSNDIFSEDHSRTNIDSHHENCSPSEPDCLHVTSQSESGCSDRVQSDTTSSAATQHLEYSDSELQPCAPIIALGGAREEELKRGLEQRLGLVLSKLARENDDDDHMWSAHVTSDHVVEDNVDDKSVSDVESTDTADMCPDIQHILMMDIVQEMDEVERYSYLSIVAYAMHQLFEYSAWNEYVIFHLLIIIPF